MRIQRLQSVCRPYDLTPDARECPCSVSAFNYACHVVLCVVKDYAFAAKPSTLATMFGGVSYFRAASKVVNEVMADRLQSVCRPYDLTPDARERPCRVFAFNYACHVVLCVVKDYAFAVKP
ncbi:hypothetical protein Emed_005712 [Eimeria media]